MMYLMIPSAYFNQLWINIRVLMCYKQAAAYYVADAVTSPITISDPQHPRGTGVHAPCSFSQYCSRDYQQVFSP